MTVLAILSIFSFLFGAVIASFLNVVIYRVPRGESIVSPPSHCPKCGAAIRWYQNIPILSWLALRGRCANCRERISPRYAIVETLGGLIFLAVFRHYGSVAGGLGMQIFTVAVMWIWVALMMVGAFIDLEHMLLPDFVSFGGMALGLGYWSVRGIGEGSWFLPLWSLAGLAGGFGLLWLVRFFGSKVFKREAMGMGDVLLMGAVGALFGPSGVLATLILSSVAGAVVGLALRRSRHAEIPYGPYICLGCLVWMFFESELLGWYLGLMR